MLFIIKYILHKQPYTLNKTLAIWNMRIHIMPIHTNTNTTNKKTKKQNEQKTKRMTQN